MPGSSLGVLDILESVPADAQDKPKEDLVIEQAQVADNPFRTAIAELLSKAWEAASKEMREKDTTKWSEVVKRPALDGGGIGKYMK